MLDIARLGGSREWRSLGIELQPINLADARNRGLGEEAARRIESRRESRRRLLSVVRLTAGTPAAALLREGDLLLSIDGRPAESFAAVERAAQAERVSLTVLRDGEELRLDVDTTAQSGRGTERFLFWQGTLLQAPHPAVSAQRGVEPGGVYVSWFWYGSPANRSRLRATHRIVEFDGVPIRGLDAFLAAASDRPNGRAVRLKTLDLDGKASVVTLKPDSRFWPTSEIRRVPDGWERIDHEQTTVSPQ
jgi:S1-C subfamily serine protease